MRRLIGYVDALPADSRTLADDPSMPWTVDRELLALTVEELSRLSRDAPIEIERPSKEGSDTAGQAKARPAPNQSPRPAPAPAPPRQGITSTPQGGTVANGFDAMIQLAQAQGRAGAPVGSSA